MIKRSMGWVILLLVLLTGGGTADSQEARKVEVYKWPRQHNPVMVQRFGADPWAMVYRDRVYLYMTGDEPVFLNGKIKTNDYANIRSIRILSSDDLVNWTDHGAVNAAGPRGAARWASNSWAPCAAWKKVDGKDRFFLYFANSGGGIGVLTADSPTGPFTDPLGGPLISRATPTCAAVTWLFDPAVLVDEDESAYLYFGGGIPQGREASPGTARAVKLAPDMIHLAGDPVAVDAPWLFEDSGINRIGDTYVYSYCTNFQVPEGGSEYGFGRGEIVYLTSDSPLGPFTWSGRVLKNPGSFFGVGGNNHHCMFLFRDRWYITYHAATVDRDRKWNAGYRSVFLDDLQMNTAGLPAPTRGTMEGVAQVQPFDPYRPAEAAQIASLAGAETFLMNPEDEAAGTGRMAVRSTDAGGWTAVAGVDFGDAGASGIRLVYRSPKDSAIAAAAEKPLSAPLGTARIEAAGEWREAVLSFGQRVTGTLTLFLRFEDPGVELCEWQALR